MADRTDASSESAFIIDVDVNAGIGAKNWDPPFDGQFDARLASGNVSDEELQLNLHTDQSLVTTRLVRGRVPEVIGMSNGPYVIAPPLRDFLEEHEPSVHRFFPIQIRTTKPVDGTQEHGIHWLLFPPPLIDCLDFKRTVFKDDIRGKDWPRERQNDRNYWGGGLPTNLSGREDPQEPVTLTKQFIEGRYLWRVATGNHPIYSKYACSQLFWDFYKTNKMIGWTIDHVCRLS
jgi:hypothetical protein